MNPKTKLGLAACAVLITLLACSSLNFSSNNTETTEPNNDLNNEPITQGGVSLEERSSDEPVLITGTIPFTSPFFINTTAEPFVLLEDQAGFITRDKEFVFPLEGQAIGPVWGIDDSTLGFSLMLPSIPQGILVDLDQNNQEDSGVMVFGVAYWANIWGDPFLEEREGTGWSTSHTTTITDAEREYEITGGYLVIWAPDGTQGFPDGFGDDQMLFTEDDPIQDVPAGYSIVDLNSEPFEIFKESTPDFELVEGASEVKDYSNMSYSEAFDTMFEKVSLEYPFTEEKNVDWDSLYAEFQPEVEAARNDYAFYEAVHDFSLRIPDAHIGVVSTEHISRMFFERVGGSFGIRLAELSDDRVIVVEVYPNTTGDQAGIQVGAEIIRWDGEPVQKALDQVVSMFGPFSTDHHARQDQLTFLTRYPEGTLIDVQFQNPGEGATNVEVTAEIELDSYFDTVWYFSADPIALPIEAETLPVGITYINVSTFSDDYNLMAQTWEYYIEGMLNSENNAGLILDLRTNGGGSSGMASSFAEYFINEEIEVYQTAYYNHTTGEFEFRDRPSKLEPGPLYYSGPVVVLVSPTCVSACEGFTHMLSLNDRATIIGHFPTAGAFGEVGRGQYSLPGDISAQFPTGRPQTIDGNLLIEGSGVQPDIVVPVTYESALGLEDAVLQAAVDFLIGN
jgi:C-terminal processing protease CtpA/Prc